METLWLKLHLAFVTLSFIVFAARLVLALKGSELANNKLVLLATLGSMALVIVSAGFLVSETGMSGGWLKEKAAGLILYIAFAFIALKPAATTLPRISLGAAATAAFMTTFYIAKSKVPLLF